MTLSAALWTSLVTQQLLLYRISAFKYSSRSPRFLGVSRKWSQMSRRGKRKFEDIQKNVEEIEEKGIEILDIGPLMLCKIISRPSVTIRSPYVADIQLAEAYKDESTYLAHSPGLDCAGIMINGSFVYCKDNRLVEKATKTKFSIQLISDARSDNVNALIGYHPQLAEDLSLSLLSKKLISGITNITNIEKQVTLGDSRVDFSLSSEDDWRTLVEVKNVVCSEYLPLEPSLEKTNTKVSHPAASSDKKGIRQCFIDPAVDYDVILPNNTPSPPVYREDCPFKCAIFPHGKKKPKIGVVSERAIKHIENLIQLSLQPKTRSVLLFIVNRSDCNAFRPCHECDLLFAQMVRKALNHGVKVIAQQVIWTNTGKAYLGKELPILIPKIIREEDINQKHLEQVLSAND